MIQWGQGDARHLWKRWVFTLWWEITLMFWLEEAWRYRSEPSRLLQPFQSSLMHSERLQSKTIFLLQIRGHYLRAETLNSARMTFPSQQPIDSLWQFHFYVWFPWLRGSSAALSGWAEPQSAASSAIRSYISTSREQRRILTVICLIWCSKPWLETHTHIISGWWRLVARELMRE